MIMLRFLASEMGSRVGQVEVSEVLKAQHLRRHSFSGSHKSTVGT